MNPSIQTLLGDAISWLKENHSPNDSFYASKDFFSSLPLQKIVKKAEEKPSHVERTIIPNSKAEQTTPLAPRLKPPSKRPQPIVTQETEKTKADTTLPPPHSMLSIEKENFLPVSELSQKVQKRFPDFSLEEKPLSDHKGLLPVLSKNFLIVSFRESNQSDLFLHNLAKAIDRSFSSSGLWDATLCSSGEDLRLLLDQGKAKLIIASSQMLKHPMFLPFIREIPSTHSRFLGESPLVILESFETYFTYPLQKKILWQTICSLLSPTNININTPASSLIKP